jgi:molybdopterin-guanine dinucleotide biosynthesis protein A
VIDRREVTLAVLAGGRGERMGGPKSGLTIRGEPILTYLLKQFDWAGPTLLVTSPGNEHPAGSESFAREVTDPVAGEGPLRGVLTALENATTDIVAVVTVDMPAVTTAMIDYLIDELDDAKARGAMYIRMIDGQARVEPFPSAFRRTAAEMIRRRLADGRRSVQGLVEERVTTLKPQAELRDTVWVNLNRPEDLELFLRGQP